VLDNIKKYFTSARIKQLTDVRNIGLYLFALVVIAITWSGVKSVQSNYELQKQISTLKQQNAVMALQNANKSLENQYLQTDQYLELAARQDFGLAAPGETVLLVSKTEALKYIKPAISNVTIIPAKASGDTRSKFVRNMESWRDFLLGRKLFSD
jgi:cell division protein FtsB